MAFVSAFLCIDDIVYFKAEDKYTRVFAKNGKKYLTDWSLQKLSKGLPDQFLRVHRSFIINKLCLLELRKYFKGQLILVLDNAEQTSLKTGKTYGEFVKKELGI